MYFVHYSPLKSKFIISYVFINKLESPLLGGDLGVGKSVISEIFTEISRPRDPPLTPPKRGIICVNLKYLFHAFFIGNLIVKAVPFPTTLSTRIAPS